MVSLTIFNIFIEELIKRLRQSGLLSNGESMLSALAYAGNLVLIAMNPRALSSLMAICNNYAIE